jgi:hypothetical protein
LTAPHDVRLSDYVALTDKQLEAVRASDQYGYLLYGGAGSGGKSFFLRWWCLRQLLKRYGDTGIKGLRVGLFSVDYPTLGDRQISRIAREFPERLGRLRQTKSDGYNFELYDEFGGGMIALRNLDRPEKYKSAEFCDIAVEELTENSKETFDDLRFRLRWPGIPDPKFAAATNPTGPGHAWVKALWIDQKFPPEMQNIRHQFCYVPALPKDNPHVSSVYEETLKSLPTHKRKALLDGDWSNPEGQYFTNFEAYERKVHPSVVGQIVQPWWNHWVSQDWGFKHHSPVHWHAVGNVLPEQARLLGRNWDVPKRCVFTYRELITSIADDNTSERELGAEIARLSGGQKISRWILSKDAFGQKTSQNTAAQLLQSGTGSALPTPSPANMEPGSRVVGWRFMYQLIQDDTWFISEMCPEALAAIPSLEYDKDKGGEDVLKTDHLYDDVGDELRYGLVDMLANARKPHEVVVQEQLAAAPDGFARHLILLNETERRNRASAPKPYWE